MELMHLIFTPQGRVGRLHFFGGYIALLAMVALLYAVPLLAMAYMYSSSETFYGVSEAGKSVVKLNYMHTNLLKGGWYAALIFVPATLLLLWGKICLDIKRFRDTGFSTWFILLLLIPWINILVFLFLLLFPGREPD